jgi:hypothetical protein
VLSVDAKSNLLTVATTDGNEVSYNPAQVRKLTDDSQVFREERREVGQGEQIRFTLSDWNTRIRSGDFATVEQITDDNALYVRHDTGKSVRLSEDHSRHIDYGYAAETVPLRPVDRVLVTGKAEVLAQQQNELLQISTSSRDLVLFTSDSNALSKGNAIKNPELGLSIPASAIDNSLGELARESFGIGR